MTSDETAGLAASKLRAEHDQAIDDRDKLVKAVRKMKERSFREGWYLVCLRLDAILAAHDSPAEAPAQGGDEHDE